MSLAHKDLMDRVDNLPRPEQWQFLVALMQHLRESPEASALSFKPKRKTVAKVDAQERVRTLRRQAQG